MINSATLVLLIGLCVKVQSEPCEFNNLCPANSVCNTLSCGDYECACDPGYYKTELVLSEDESKLAECAKVEVEGSVPEAPCEPNPCSNGGLCVAAENGTYTCQCQDERYQGPNCRSFKPQVQIYMDAYIAANITQYIDNSFEYSYTGNEVTSDNEKHAVIFDRSMYTRHNIAAVSNHVYMFEDAQMLLQTSRPFFALHYVGDSLEGSVSIQTKSEGAVQEIGDENFVIMTGNALKDGHVLEYTTEFSKLNPDKPSYARVFFAIRKKNFDEDSVDLIDLQPETKVESKYTRFGAWLYNPEEGDVLGFTLLSSYKANATTHISQDEIARAMDAILDAHAVASKLDSVEIYPEDGVVEQMALAVESEDTDLSRVIENLYEYNVKEDTLALTSDLGGDIYSSGLYINVGGIKGLIHYGQTYQQGNYEFTSMFDQVFMGLLWISNKFQKQENFTLSTQGFVPQFGTGHASGDKGKFSFSGGFRVHFAYSQIFNGSNDENSVCEVYFAMYSPMNWGSSIVTENDFTLTNKAEGTFGIADEMVLTGNPKKVLAGFMVLSKKNLESTGGNMFEKSEVLVALKRKLRPIAKEDFGSCVNK